MDDNDTNRRIPAADVSELENESRRGSRMQRTRLEQLRHASETGPPFDLVLTDASMPDGRWLHARPHIHQDNKISSVVVMMLTSLDQTATSKDLERLGIRSFLVKPVKQSDLMDAIMLAMDGRRTDTSAVPADPGVAPVTLPPLRILLAEDSLANQKLAIGLLKRWGHSTTVANNGAEAVDHGRAR